jgi:hypothetical protein
MYAMAPKIHLGVNRLMGSDHLTVKIDIASWSDAPYQCIHIILDAHRPKPNLLPRVAPEPKPHADAYDLPTNLLHSPPSEANACKKARY